MIKKILLTSLLALGTVTFGQQNCVYMASDVYPGTVSSLPVLMTEFNGALYFSATGNASGKELWKFENGTASMVADVNPGSGSSLINQLTVLGSELYFVATNSTTGSELYKYDGVSVTNAADIFPGVGGSQISYLTVIGSELYFLANDGTTGMEPWKFDGVTATQVADINPGSGGSNANAFAGAGGNVYFTAFDPTYGFELFKYDGVNPPVVYDLYPGPQGSDIGEITPIGNKVCFRATNGTQGYELWTHDGTTATCLDVNITGAGDFTPWEFTPFGSEVFFRGYIDGTGYELWKYDGTDAIFVADIFPGADNAHPSNLTAGSTVLYFAADNGVNGNELHMYDGSTVSLVGDIRPGASGSMPTGWTEEFVTIGDKVFLIADDGSSGNEVWGYDGTTLELSRDIVQGTSSSNPTAMAGFGTNQLFFMADDLNSGAELWVWEVDKDLSDSISVVSCGNYTSPAGDLYTVEGTYDFVDTIPSVGCPACDSLVTVHLIIGNPDTSITVYACNDYNSPAGDYYNVQGNYVFTDTIPSVACPGVDSIINIDLTIQDNVNLTIFAFSGVVFATQPGAQYQWLDCDNGYAPIPGETDQDYIPIDDGNYAVEITLGNCVDTSQCMFVESTWGIGFEEETQSQISVYPNPVNDVLYIANTSSTSLSVRIFNTTGGLIFSDKNESTDKMIVDMSGFAKGIYYLQITTPVGIETRKVVKE